MTALEEALASVAGELRELADVEAATQMARYMKGHFAYLGVKSPARKQVQKPLIAAARTADPGDLLAVADACWALDEREFQYVGADVLRAGAKHLRAGDLDRLRALIETKSWWDTVDTLAAHPVGTVVRNNPELTSTMDAWIDDDNMWIARTAILHQLTYKQHTDAARLFAYAEKRASDTEFFIRKALGWALRSYARIDPDAVYTFVAAHPELSGLTKREALKHLV